MATPSRRTPAELAAAVRENIGDGFFWDGAGDNPYPAMLALADAMLVTGDSANMVGEATATGAPVHVFEPSGGVDKLARHRCADRPRRGAALERRGSRASLRADQLQRRDRARDPAAASRARRARG